MATRRLFDEDSHLCDFAAEIVALRAEGPWVALDSTAFFPEDGGQPSDRGTLAGLDVVGLAVDGDGTIWHHLAGPIDGAVGSVVDGRVDAAVRRDHRQQHTGQHILSRAFVDTLGAETRSFHLGADVSTIDLAIDALDFAKAASAESRANAVVFEDREVVVTTEPRAEGLPLRTVAILGFEEQHCCGTHVKRTGEVGLIKVLRWERIRGLTRAHFVCGGRALRVFASLVETVDAAARPFSAGWTDLPHVVQGALDQTKTLERRSRDWQRRWAALEAERIARETASAGDGVLSVRAWVDGADAETLRALASELTDRRQAVVVLAGTGEPERRVWLAARSKELATGRTFHAKEVLSEIVESLGGRGGGNDLFAQGSCPADEETCRARLASSGP